MREGGGGGIKAEAAKGEALPREDKRGSEEKKECVGEVAFVGVSEAVVEEVEGEVVARGVAIVLLDIGEQGGREDITAVAVVVVEEDEEELEKKEEEEEEACEGETHEEELNKAEEEDDEDEEEEEEEEEAKEKEEEVDITGEVVVRGCKGSGNGECGVVGVEELVAVAAVV